MIANQVFRELLIALVICWGVQAPAAAQSINRIDDSSQFRWNRELSVVRVAKNPGKGFHYPYFLRIPAEPGKQDLRLLVEPNNTGIAVDEFAIHEQAAQSLIVQSYAAKIAGKLNVPLLVPVFPRARSDWQAYTHALDDDTLRITDIVNRRIDLQLIAMIQDARAYSSAVNSSMSWKSTLRSRRSAECMPPSCSAITVLITR